MQIKLTDQIRLCRGDPKECEKIVNRLIRCRVLSDTPQGLRLNHKMLASIESQMKPEDSERIRFFAEGASDY